MMWGILCMRILAAGLPLSKSARRKESRTSRTSQWSAAGQKLRRSSLRRSTANRLDRLANSGASGSEKRRVAVLWIPKFLFSDSGPDFSPKISYPALISQ